ncbi:MAG: diacylglycerol kinase family protein [Candidatus Methylacidiphilales bacterium]|nr:diacylglycerol kinase family protein [Candidatus Methylacidiphilales bacterium]
MHPVFKILRSFPPAFRGITLLIRSQTNARVHLVATLVVIVAGIWQKASAVEWGLLSLAIGLVWTAEAFNTALEWLADRVTTEKDAKIRDLKDVAAAGVLLAAFTSLAIAGCVFFA